MLVPLLALATLAACTQEPPTASVVASAEGLFPEPIFAPASALETEWRRVTVWRDAPFALTAEDGEVVIAAQATGASAALVTKTEIDVERCPVVEWRWRVDAMALPADLSSRQAEDTPASIILAFGDPGSLLNPDEVPTLRYAWASETNPVGAVVDSPYFPGILRTVVVRSGPPQPGVWVTERRDLAADYEAAFGSPPRAPVEVVALFTDADHQEDGRAEAFYGPLTALCTEPADPPSIFDS
ncbi:MAG: DUF3047 domain-containing protein [Pseudomonadota bacterium]